MLHKWSLTGLLTCFSMAFAIAQTDVSGMVMEETKDGKFKPIPFANVYWIRTQSGTSTDTNGAFTLPINPSTDTLIVSYVGYAGDTVKVEKPDQLTIVLKPYQMLDAVNIVYEKRGTEISYLDPLKVENIGEKELFKAACCNLSESFETNPSVDVAYTDAVTGTKQIQMLGLDGKYSQITKESMPEVRGLSSVQGLTYIPGTWIESIQLNKGAGSVVNGFESVTGQINVELKKPESSEPFFLNAYVNQGGRSELNINAAHKFSEKLATGLLLHGNMRPMDVDGNNDGFLDFPTGYQLNAINRWKFSNLKGWEGQVGFRALTEDRRGGQYYQPESDSTPSPYDADWKTNRIEAWAKTGYVFPNAKYNSVGLQAKVLNHDFQSKFGPNDYIANQQTLYLNAIYQGIFRNTSHKYKFGASFQYDQYSENLNAMNYSRTEAVPGAFFEYTYNYMDRFAVVAGIRGDYHNYYGFFVTPRLHLRYELAEGSVLRASGGRGARTANVIAENLSLLATSRSIVIEGNNAIQGYGLKQEIAWNSGLNFTQEFRLNYRPGTFSADVYHTFFENQVVVDMENPREARFYNLDGRSYATSLQAQVDYSPIRRLDVRLAYRWYDVKTQYNSGLKSKPYIASNRAFTNLSYEIVSGWKFDYTFQWQGQKRIPSTGLNPLEFQRATKSPDLFLMNAQITKSWNEVFDIYLGMENITNVKQQNPIIAASDPQSTYFDSSMIWGPIFGRMTYLGIRWNPSKVSSKKVK